MRSSYWIAYTGERAVLDCNSVLTVVDRRGAHVYSPRCVHRADDGDFGVILEWHGKGWRMVSEFEFEQAGGITGEVL